MVSFCYFLLIFRRIYLFLSILNDKISVIFYSHASHSQTIQEVLMEKNKFLMINDLIYEIHLWQKISDVDASFFQRLKMIVPFEYASLFLCDSCAGNPFSLSNPICFPQAFEEAELQYLQFASEDNLQWILHGKESKLIRRVRYWMKSTA